MPTFAETMVSKMETLLSENPGAKIVSVDGRMVTFDDLLKQYEYWKGQVARESGARPAAAQIDLSGFGSESETE